MSVRQAAEVLGMHYKTLSRALRENTIPLNFIRKGWKFGIRPEDVAELMHRREVIRDGSGRPKPRTKPKLQKRIAKSPSRFLTDKQVRALFGNLERDRWGKVTAVAFRKFMRILNESMGEVANN